jgi:glycosyltransferase involved in cell wall biosynthesis
MTSPSLRNVLVITYYWPPSGGPGVQRILKFCKYLPEFGWNPIVLTVANGEFQVIDRTLAKEINPGWKIYQSRTFEPFKIFKWLTGKKEIPTFQLSKSRNDNIAIRISRWTRYNLVVPDARVGWYLSAIRKCVEIMSQNKIDLIFSSGPPHSVHLITMHIAKRGVTWVADFRDPWIERFYYQENRRWFLAEKLDAHFEKKVLRVADRITTASPGIKALLYKKVRTDKIKVIYNGYDEPDFKSTFIRYNRDSVIISYIGTLSKSQVPDAFFQAIAELKLINNSPKLRLKFIGNVHSSLKEKLKNKYRLLNITTYYGYVPHSLALQFMQNSDFLLLVIPRTKHNTGIVPGKLFEYIRSMRPIILIGPLDSDAARIIQETKTGIVFDYHDVNSIQKFLLNPPKMSPINIDRYSRRHSTEILAQLFKDIC